MHDAATLLSLLDRIGREVAQALLMPSLEAIALGAAVWVVLHVWRGSSPRLRHLLWLMVMIKPVATLVLPWHGPIALPVPHVIDQGVRLVIPSDPILGVSETARRLSASNDWSAALRHPYALIAVIWGTGVSAGLVWTLVGGLLLVRRCRQTEPIAVPWVHALFTRCMMTLGLERQIKLRMSHRFASPTLVTIGQPVVVIPSWCFVRLSPQELKQVFLHELLHYARRDHLTVWLAQLVRIFFFFHPIVWYAGRRLGAEAERACDVDVVTVARKPYSYAASLLKVAEGSTLARWRGVLELARPVSLTATRIREVLNGIDDRQRVVSLGTTLLLIGLTMLVLPPVFHLSPPTTVSEPSQVALQTPDRPRTLNPGLMTSGRLASALETGDAGTAMSGTSRTPPPEPAHAAAANDEPSQVSLVLGRPAAIPRPASSWLVRPASLQASPDGTSSRRSLNSAALGSSHAPATDTPRTDEAARWQPGQIEVQGGGHPLSKVGLSGMMSVRAGYFVTKTHELGGVLSIIGPAERLEVTDEQKAITSPVNLPALSPLRARPVASLGTDQQEATGPTVSNTLLIGAFYRYNVAGLSVPVVPFIGVGAGLEVRSGRNPVLIDGSGGVRCFFMDRAAVIVQFDYYKDVDISTRSRVSASLGVATIF